MGCKGRSWGEKGVGEGEGRARVGEWREGRKGRDGKNILFAKRWFAEW